MLCVSIRPQSEEELRIDHQSARQFADIVEIRVDGFEKIPFDALKEIFKKPCIAAIGSLKDPELLLKLAALGPTWLDVPHDIPIYSRIRKEFPHIKLIASSHEFEGDLVAHLQTLQQHKADMVKIITLAKSGLDGLKMLSFLKRTKTPLTAFCMGPEGQFTRVLAKIYGSQITYSCLENKPTAPGQISVNELLDIYGWNNLKPTTRPYALIGDPVSHSLSHITHNALFRKTGMDAVYVKVPISAEEAPLAMPYFVELGFAGLSITRPLKSVYTPEAHNTVRWHEGHPQFMNSDGRGLIDAIEEFEPVKDKKVILLGAGSTAQACALEAHKRGAKLVILNRTEVKAFMLAKSLGCKYAPWKLEFVLSSGYDILINATSIGNFGEHLPLNESNINKSAIIADVIAPQKTHLVQLAERCGARVVSGLEMWLRQAAYQFCFWNKELIYDEVLVWLRQEIASI